MHISAWQIILHDWCQHCTECSVTLIKLRKSCLIFINSFAWNPYKKIYDSVIALCNLRVIVLYTILRSVNFSDAVAYTILLARYEKWRNLHFISLSIYKYFCKGWLLHLVVLWCALEKTLFQSCDSVFSFMPWRINKVILIFFFVMQLSRCALWC